MTSLLRTHACIMFNGVFVHPFFPDSLGRKHPNIQTSAELVLRCGTPLFPEAKFPYFPCNRTPHLLVVVRRNTSWWSSQSVPPQQLKDLVKHPEILRESGTVFQQRWVPACVHTPSLRFEEGPGYATQKPGFHQLYPPGFAWNKAGNSIGKFPLLF